MYRKLLFALSLTATLAATAVTFADGGTPPGGPPVPTPGDCVMAGLSCGNKDYNCALQSNSVCAVPPTPLPPNWPPSNWHDGNSDGCGCVY